MKTLEEKFVIKEIVSFKDILKMMKKLKKP
jgi:hypothetical protein